MKKKINNIEYFIYILITILIVFFLTESFILYLSLIIFTILILIIVRKNFKIIIPKNIIYFSVLILLSFLHIIISASDFSSIESNVKEIIRFAFYIMLIIVVSNLTISYSVFKKMWTIVFLTVFTISVMQFLKLFDINNKLISFYGESIHLLVSEKYDSLDLFRAGSVFINPNGYAKFILLFFVIFLYFYSFKMKNNIKNLIILIIISFSFILAGSRTGILIGILLACVKIININFKQIKFKRTSVFNVLYIILFFITILVVYLFIGFNLEPFRILNISQGIQISLGYKYETFINILGFFNNQNHFFGLGAFNTNIENLTLIDFDFGYLYSFYGIIGVFIYLNILRGFYLNRDYNIPNKFVISILIIMFLFGITGGVLFNIRYFSLIILILSIRIKNDSGGNKNESHS